MTGFVNEVVCAAIIAQIQVDEGGVKDVGDGMGVTRYGQTDGWLTQYGLPRPTSPEMAAQNWRDWMRMTKLDQITGLNQPLAHAVADWAAMSGVSVAVRALQGAVGASQDGILGPETIAAVAHADQVRVAHRLLERRRRAYLETALATVDQTVMQASKLKFILGWNDRCARDLAEVHGVTL